LDRSEARTGACHLDQPVSRFSAESPFDYASQSEVLIVTDLKRGDVASLAGAYSRLIEAAGGGTLGLFTAIQRLKAVHSRVADRLARTGLPLYAQHVDPIDTGTLVDIFRDDPRASLLGTDALRDGVDVPGESLRLVVMEGIPWPRPTVLHAARRTVGGGSAYDDRVVRAASRRRSGGSSGARRIAACSCCSSRHARRACSPPFRRACPIRRVPLATRSSGCGPVFQPAAVSGISTRLASAGRDA
jgi:ATP-dependent DNA helicase DinG